MKDFLQNSALNINSILVQVVLALVLILGSNVNYLNAHNTTLSCVDIPALTSSVKIIHCTNSQNTLYKGTIHYDALIYPDILFDWPFDGTGDFDDSKSVFFDTPGVFEVSVVMPNGQITIVSVDTDSVEDLVINPKDLILSSTEQYGQSEYMFHLDRTLDLDFGDLDGDHHDGSFFNVDFYKSYDDAEWGIQPLAMEYPSEGDEMLFAKVSAGECYEISSVFLQRAEICVQLEISEACENDNLIPFIPHLCRTNPLEDKVYLPTNGDFNILQFDSNTGAFVVRNDLLQCTVDSCFILATESASYQIEYTYVNEFGQTDTGIALMEIQDPNSQLLISQYEVCENGSLIIARANPDGGTLSGEGVVSEFEDGGEVFYFIDPSLLEPNSKFIYKYLYEQTQGSTLICSIESEDSIFILPIPDISIEQDLSTVCEGNNVVLNVVNNDLSQTLTYQWLDGNSNILGTEASLTLTNVAADINITLSANSSNQCTHSVSTLIEVEANPEVSCAVATSLQCYGDSNGSAQVTIAGSNVDYSDYQIIWSNGMTTRSINNLTAGSYNVSVSNLANGCISECLVTVDQPEELGLELPFTVINEISCNSETDATIELNAIGGQAPYSYSTNGGPFQASPVFSNLGEGAINIVIRDANNCEAQNVIEITGPEVFEVNDISVTEISCFGDSSGSISATLQGGTLPYFYSWNTGAISSSIDNLTSGTYMLTATDSNGCSTTASVILQDPTEITSTTTHTGECINFDVNLSVSGNGGSGALEYRWILTDDGGTGINAVDDFTFNADNSMLSINTLGADPGTLEIVSVVSDQNGCELMDTVLIPIRHCFDLAIRKTTSTQVAYPGDVVRFEIEVFNQGEIDAFNVEITDYVPSGLIFRDIYNSAVYTANPNDWVVSNNEITYTIAQLNANSSNVILIYLEVDQGADSFELINVSEITNYSDSEINLPIDEDDIISCIDAVETDDDIDDDSNGSVDNPCDDDQLDGANIIVCSFDVNEVSVEYCVNNEDLAACFNILDDDLRDLLDPLGDGDGMENGDAGNLIASFHNTAMDAENNTNSIDPCVTSSVSVLYARLVTQSNCVFAIPLRVLVNEMPTIDIEPVSVSLPIGSDVTFSVEATGNNLVYQWQIFDNGAFVDIPLATSSSYIVSNTTVTDNNAELRVLVANGDHLECELSSQVVLNVIESDFNLYCNDLVNVSVDADCLVDISPDLLLQGSGYPDYIEIVVEDQDGNIIMPPYDSEMIGDTFLVNVLDLLENNSCWSTIFVEDKLPPVIDCPSNVTIDCSSTNIFAVPTAIDNCGEPAEVFLIDDIYTEIDCDPIVEGVRVITYQAVDVNGNISAVCSHEITYQKLNVSNIVIPVNIDNVTSPAFNCDNTRGLVNSTNSASLYSATIWDLNDNDYPDPIESGFPMSVSGDTLQNTNGPCSLNISYEDDIIDVCGASMIILRSWTIVDWCSGELIKGIQKISILDNTPPVVICTDDQVDGFSVELFDYQCTLDWQVEAPATIFDCSDATWYVEYLLADENGQAPSQDDYQNENVTGSYPNLIIRDLPLGRTWLKYVVTDECGNASECFTEINIIDVQAPNAVCDANTVVALVDGWAKINAISIDDGSEDACSDSLMYGIRRTDNSCVDFDNHRTIAFNISGYGDYYEAEYFCCTDTGSDIEVELMVVDIAGNFNNCVANVIVLDKVAPEFTFCPDDITVDCGILDATQFFDDPIVSDNCNITNLSFVDVGAIGDCGVGEVTRFWTLKDGTDNQVTCSQRVSVVNQNAYSGPSSSDWPGDITMDNACLIDLDPSVIVGGYPTIDSDLCQHVASTYSDEIFNDTFDACYQILRTWTVIDWCQYNNSNSTGVWTHTQTIKINNTVLPQLDCELIEFCTDGDNCSAFVDYTHTASDDCTPEDILFWTYDLDIDNDDIVDISGLGSSIQYDLAVGTHSVVWTVEDRCGNINTCTQDIKINDCDSPTPYCLSGITTVIMPSSGTVEIWASDFDLGSSDNCDTDLTFSFSSDPSLSNLSFDCDQLGVQPLEFWMTDDAGNQNFCLVMIDIQSNNDSPCSSPTSRNYAGKIYSHTGTMMDNVDVVMKNITTESVNNTQTDSLGLYSFVMDQQGLYDLEINAKKTDNPLDGVSTLDLLMMQRHILGIEVFDSPYEVIAADVNLSNSVSSIDIITLRKLILGVIDDFPNGTSWCFIDNNDPIEDALNPWPISEQHSFGSSDDLGPTALDFIGVKLGDINGDVSNNLTSESGIKKRQDDQLSLYVDDFMFSRGEEFTVDLKVSDAFNLSGMQYSLEFDNDILQLIDVDSDALDLYSNNYKISKDDTGTLILSWSEATNVMLNEGAAVMTLKFKAYKQSNIQTSIFGFSDVRFKSEVYDDNLQRQNLVFTVIKRKDHFELFQNSPNPFVSYTNIDFTIPEDDDVTLSIYTTSGRLVYSEVSSCIKGLNQFKVSKSELNGQQGLLYYSINTTRFRQIKSMVIMEN